MKKTSTKNIAGGTKTTVTDPAGNKTVTYNGVSNLHIGHTYTYDVPISRHQQSANNNQVEESKELALNSTNYASKIVKTGATFKEVKGSLPISSKEVSDMLASKHHKTYTSAEAYKASRSADSRDHSSQTTHLPDFKR